MFKLGQLIKYFQKSHRKVYWKCAPETSPRLLFDFGK